jgi:hypothetical protein
VDRRFSHHRRVWLPVLIGALAILAFPAAALAATPATSCTAVPASNPCYNTAPAIVAPTGAPPSEVASPKVGIFLQVNIGTWTPPQQYPSVQWTQDCNLSAAPANQGTPIAGAINRTYQVADSDAGHTLCVIFDTGGVEMVLGPTGAVAPSAPFLNPPPSAPTISGSTVQGQTLTATSGVWRGTGATTGGIKFAYQWKRCNSAGQACGKPFTPPSSSPTYTLQQADVGHTMQVLVTATNSVGSTQAGAKHATAVVTPPTSSSPPSNPGGQGGSNNGNGSNNGGHGGTPTSGGSSSIRALLMNALLVRGNGARIAALLKHGGYAFSFAAPSAGRLVISWYRRSHGKKILVATALVLFHKSGTARIKVLLTGKGRGLLTRASRMKLTASGAFTPTGKGTVSASRVIVLKP